MWHVATYQPVTFFSLRPANATTAGGKTLVTPTPYAFKMALLNAAIRVYGLEQGKAWFPRLRDLEVAIRLPDALLVIGTFQRIRRPRKETPTDTGLIAVWQSNIAFREYVHFGGPLVLAVQEPEPLDPPLPWEVLFSQINYLGKRGSFVQFMGYETADDLPWEWPGGFVWLNPDTPGAIEPTGLLQLLDDCGPKMTFAHADIYDKTRLKVGNYEDGRQLKTVVLPYRMSATARGFTLYERLTA
ncbi:MAG TPA: hypothetical protein ENI95_01425 [Chloroflexi bacterium]|nr:hypothetical protein [Chloroflexota bacterium]